LNEQSDGDLPLVVLDYNAAGKGAGISFKSPEHEALWDTDFLEPLKGPNIWNTQMRPYNVGAEVINLEHTDEGTLE